MSRLDASGLAILVELGLTSSDAGWRLADAADSGPQVVRVAKKYKGATYKWSGASLRGSDCSGFTWYVCKKVTGKNITRGAKEQSKHGRSVSRDKWRPGNLVFFENMFERGLSHVGIYIKGDDFNQAENKRTGVVISSLSSDYFSKHYAGARRFL